MYSDAKAAEEAGIATYEPGFITQRFSPSKGVNTKHTNHWTFNKMKSEKATKGLSPIAIRNLKWYFQQEFGILEKMKEEGLLDPRWFERSLKYKHVLKERKTADEKVDPK